LDDVTPIGSVAVRRSSFIVTYWERGRHWAECYLTRTRRECDARALEILEMANEWTSRCRICDALDPARTRAIEAMIEELVGEGFLEPADEPRSAAAMKLDGWSAWNPSAGFFHAASTWLSPQRATSAPATDSIRPQWRIAASSLLHPMPPSLKTYSGSERTPLPPFARDGELADVLSARRSWRAFGDRPITVDELSQLLGATFAVREWMDVGEMEWVALKSSPSGGARHSVEAYIVARRVDGLASGIYHYDPDLHALETLRADDPGAMHQVLASAMPTQPWFHDCAALVVMTSVFARMQWKYSHAHAYRVVFLDAGHLGQTFLLTATSLGLAPFCTAAIDSGVLESQFEIDGISEAVLYAVGVGAKRSGMEWEEATIPEGIEPPATRPPAWARQP
jgi:SagB-type dehydrogenase family enzyme